MRFLICAGFLRTELTFFLEKMLLLLQVLAEEKVIIVSEGKYKTEVEELLSGLKVSLHVNNIDLKKIHIIYNADNLSEEDLEFQCQELSETLKIE